MSRTKRSTTTPAQREAAVTLTGTYSSVVRELPYGSWGVLS